MELRITAATRYLLLVFLMLVAFSPSCIAIDHIVGANRGWQPPADAGENVHLNYTVWSESQTFYVGDVIRNEESPEMGHENCAFHYQENMQYSVFQVNYSVYTNCTISLYGGQDWIHNWTTKGGRSQVPLDKAMEYYFVDANNCKNGMKVPVKVIENTTATHASTSTAATSSEKSTKSLASSKLQLFTLPLLFSAQAFLFISLYLLIPAL